VKEYIVGIDASRNRSGGAIRHITEILKPEFLKQKHIKEIHIWSYNELLDSINDFPGLVKHNSKWLKRSLLWQIMWQYFILPKELMRMKCDIAFYLDGGGMCPFKPYVTMSRDMLPFEPNEMNRYRFTKGWLRLLVLRYWQIFSFRRAAGVIFLTSYAANKVMQLTGEIKNYKIIPHGVNENIRKCGKQRVKKLNTERLNLIYVSGADLYKHQWNVVAAVEKLCAQSHDVHLKLVGGASGKPKELLDESLSNNVLAKNHTELVKCVGSAEIVNYLAEADIFLFASSCENMPNTLLEGMAAALPIACSNRGPMPEVLKNNGVYFDPEDVNSIYVALQQLITNKALCSRLQSDAYNEALQYSWERCANETWDYIYKVHTTYDEIKKAVQL
jgi:glycosyltransferase involved in cell wall biosynthesis